MLMASSSAMRPKYRPCGNEDFSMIWSAACQQPGFSRSFMRISLAVARSGCLGSYAAATIPSNTATSKGWSSCSRRWPASATDVVMVASRACVARYFLCSSSKVFLCYPSALGSIRPARLPATLSAASRTPGKTARPANAAWGEVQLLGLRAKSRGALVCRCASSHYQKTRQALVQRLAGHADGSGAAGGCRAPLGLASA